MVKFLLNPILPVAQNEHFMAQPTYVDIQRDFHYLF